MREVPLYGGRVQHGRYECTEAKSEQDLAPEGGSFFTATPGNATER